MGSINKLRAALGATFVSVAVASTLTVSQPANAAAAYDSLAEGDLCVTGYTCLWDFVMRQSSGVGFYNDAWNFASIPSSYRWIENRAISGQNHTGGSNVTKLYRDAGGAGTSRCLKAGQYDSDFNNDSFAERASALVWSSSCGSVTVFR
jgi:hypothetical protein